MGLASIALSAEQVAAFRKEQAAVWSILDAHREINQKSPARCAACWTIAGNGAEGCAACGHLETERPALWPPGGLGLYRGVFIVQAAAGFPGILDVRDGESVTEALDRRVLEGR